MIYIFEGLDNCLKDTLIKRLRGAISPFSHVIKYSSPPNLQDVENYQKLHFQDMFNFLTLNNENGKRNLILNRAHLGEYVYSPLYRGYEGSWIFELENIYLQNESNVSNTCLILMYDSSSEAIIKREDGKSLSKMDNGKIDQERKLFLAAYDKSRIKNKIKFDLSNFSNIKGNIDIDLIFEEMRVLISY